MHKTAIRKRKEIAVRMRFIAKFA